MADEVSATTRRNTVRRVRFDETTTRQTQAAEIPVMDTSFISKQNVLPRQSTHSRDASDIRSSRRSCSLPSSSSSSPTRGCMLAPRCLPIQIPGLIVSSSSSPRLESSTTPAAVWSEQSPSRGQGGQLLPIARSQRKNESSMRRHTIMEPTVHTHGVRTPSSRLPRYSQISRHSNDETHGNLLENLNAVDRRFPPRYSTGTIPEILSINDDVFDDEDHYTNANTETVATHARAIIFLFLCTVDLVMGVILCIVAAKANSSRPADMSTSAYTWPGILLIALGLEGITLYSCLRHSVLTRFLLSAAIMISLACLSLNLHFALLAKTDSETFESDYQKCLWSVNKRTCHCYQKLEDLVKQTDLSRSPCSPRDADIYNSYVTIFICNITSAFPDIITFILAVLLMKKALFSVSQERDQSQNTNIALTSVIVSPPSPIHSNTYRNTTNEENETASNVTSSQHNSNNLPPPYAYRTGGSLPDIRHTHRSNQSLPSYHTAMQHPTIAGTLSHPENSISLPQTDDDVFL